MKQLTTIVLMAVGVLSSSALEAAPCLGTQTLSGLVGLLGTGCTVGDKLFADFTFTTEGTLAGLDASAINVLTSTTPQGNEVLTFIGGLTADGGLGGGFITGIINYTVRTVTGAALIEDLSLSVGPVFSAGLGPNSASAVE